MPTSLLGRRFGLLMATAALGAIVGACAGSAPSASSGSSPLPSTATGAPSTGPSSKVPASPVPSGSTAPEASGGTSHGDIPDNAVFLTYHGTTPVYSIQYVEGWQVSQASTGVVIRDKDSSESVVIAPVQADVAAYVAATDLPALQATAGFALVKQDTVKVRGVSYVHLFYHQPALPDPVTGKQVPSTVDRYYVPGPNGLAIVSLSTPDGVDNVDAFRQMIESFKWS